MSPAMLLAMLALFVALSGTAVATTSALITGAQIKNNSITGTDVKNKSLTGQDIKGQLPGPQGPQGAKGDKGDKGDKGNTGNNGAQGPPGPFPQGDLPSGTSIRGNYGVGGPANSTAHAYFVDIEYGYQMSAPLAFHWIPVLTDPPVQCPGNVNNPQAAAGHLCIYERDSFNVLGRSLATGGSSRWGASPFIASGTGIADSNSWSHGTWAATAP